MWSAVRSLILLTWMTDLCLGLYSKKGDVQILTEKNFDHTIKGSDQVTIVEFFAPWVTDQVSFVKEC